MNNPFLDCVVMWGVSHSIRDCLQGLMRAGRNGQPAKCIVVVLTGDIRHVPDLLVSILGLVRPVKRLLKPKKDLVAKEPSFDSSSINISQPQKVEEGAC